MRIRLSGERTGEVSRVSEDQLMRVFCHFLVQQMPTQAIPDVVQDLKDAWTWWFQAQMPHVLPEASSVIVPGVSADARVQSFYFDEE